MDLAAWVDAAIQLFKAIVWPGVVLILASKFKPQLQELILRLRKGPFNLGWSGPQTQSSEPLPLAKLADVNAAPESENKVVAAAMKLIRDDPRLKQAVEPEERERLLIHELAESQLVVFLERIHGWIWASQMRILRHLNAKGPVGDTASNLKPFYDSAAQAYPQVFGEYPFENYLEVFQTRGLIERDGDVAKITDIGREYLKYVASAGLPEPVAG